MLNTEDSQKNKRRTDSTENNGAFEKKQRVEQLVTALARPTKKDLSSTSSLDSVDLNMDKNMVMEESGDINIDVVSTDDSSLKPITNTSNNDNTSIDDKKSPTEMVPSFSPPCKPVAKVVHFSPKIIQVESIAEKKPTTRSKASGGKIKKGSAAFVPPPIPSGTMIELSYKATPQTMTRVPRDQNVPLIVYNPPRPKPIGAGAPVLPVLPMTTCGSLIIQAPTIFSPPGTIPPTLISASQLKKIAKQTSFARIPTKPTTKFLKAGPKDKKPPVSSNQIPQQQQCQVVFKKEELNESSILTKCGKNFKEWTVNEVHEHFLKSDCAEHANIFKEQEIDGKALCHLDEMNIPKLLKVKMGPAIKMSAIIRSLKNF